MQAVLDCCALHYPDTTKSLVLETDASTTGWGYVLYQFDTIDYIIEPIIYGGAKFSDAATRWAIIKQECYSVYGTAKAAEPYLLARPFFLHNDHQYLEAIALSTVPMIVCIRIYLQSYIMLWRHVSGPLSVGGNSCPVCTNMPNLHLWSSLLPNPPPRILLLSSPKTISPLLSTPSMAAAMVTLVIVLPTLPSANSFLVTRSPDVSSPGSMNDKFTSIVRTNNVDHHRKRIGLDGVTITPTDKHGMCYVYLIVVSSTKLVAGYPVPEHSALVTYGHYDELATDPGSDIMSDGVAMYLQWIGTSHRGYLVDVHTSNGVEPYCKQVIILLRALVQDERVEDFWSEPQNFGTILFIINSNINSETSRALAILPQELLL